MPVPPVASRLLAAVLALWVLAACSLLEFAPGTGPAATGDVADDRFPDVLAVDLQPRGDGSYDVAVTLSSPYDTPRRYADGWRVLDAAGNVLGTHTLLHDHAAEQPFTRTQRGLLIPDGVDEVTVEGRDLANGFGGRSLTVGVPD